MLQQTQVKTVLGYYERWMRRFPNLEALASANEADVLHIWQGLGYYSRARRLLSGARAVVERHGGKLPRTVQELRALPGIGDYSAGAIASIAFGLPEPVVDGNVVRVLCRAFGLRGDPERAPLKRRIWQLARELVPRESPADFNQALMELGATICTPRAPRCPECPLEKRCAARAQGLTERLPESRKRGAPTALSTAAALVTRGERVLLRQVPADAARWASLWVLPFVELAAGQTALEGAQRALAELGLHGRALELERELVHSITRFRITLSVVRCALAGRAAPVRSDYGFYAPAALRKLALPSVHARILRGLQE